MFHKLVVFMAACRRVLSRSEWMIRLLGLPVVRTTGHERGLILVQIDGLSHPGVKEAIKRGRMPFLGRLIRKEHHRLHLLYSGLPSSTPAMQAELFYGVKGAVPGFSFLDHESGTMHRMHESAAATKYEKRLSLRGTGLLKGGSAYSSVFTGGAAESRFCATNLGWGELFQAVLPRHLSLIALLYADIFIRTAVLLSLEFKLALWDFLRGAMGGKGILKELAFIPTRVAICILLREFVTACAKIDAARGLPVIHVNFLGYDEQAHRRGPGSSFAHWSLRGIDNAIERLWNSARASKRRDYDVWVYSDHGQAAARLYEKANGVTLDAAVAALFGETPRQAAAGENGRGIQAERAGWLGRFFLPKTKTARAAHVKRVHVAALGALGHIYPPYPLSEAEAERTAQKLVREANIPLVFTRNGRGGLNAWSAAGTHELPEEAAAVFGAHHPFLRDIARDLLRVAAHPDAGTILISGWKAGEAGSLTFQQEYGTHGGLSPDETSAFALVSRDAGLPHDRPYVRPLDLRHAALRALGRISEKRLRGPSARVETFRLMTYNVHSCIGMDGRLSPDRIARIIAHHAPDVVALQEIEVRCERTGCVDQVEKIARKLEMEFHFHPSFLIEDGAFGNALLSRFPIRDMKRGPLPRIAALGAEPRGVLSAVLDVNGRLVRMVNTHLSIWPVERVLQARALKSEWAVSPQMPLVLCGDFNALPLSGVHRIISGVLSDAQGPRATWKAHNTWAGYYPVVRIDHVFISEGLRALKAEAPATALERNASDHLPLIVDLVLDARRTQS